MGCGNSQVTPEVAADQRPLEKPVQNNNGYHKSTEASKKKSVQDSKANKSDSQTNNQVPRSVAFTVDLDGKETQNTLIGPPPPRLKRLDPLNVPKLTASELAEKQRQADEKREQEIRRKKSASLKASRRRLQILEAQKFEQEFQQKEKQEKIEEALESAEKTRDAKLKERQERQKIREQRAERAREKVKKLNELDHELDIEVEKDSDYNADEVDSWLEGDNNNNKDATSADSDENIYNGRSSPHKTVKRPNNALNRGMSEKTIDSFDDAYNRNQTKSSFNPAQVANEDEFFDT
ncbi:uncharacterized protein DDB_G0284459-like [Dreissena polymorpha]|uniref:uncharacterized protein DDB_G0284459-like n=1 Tax=Dreissena polymorpha TaxID=45954 RepID=UPI002264DC51|nr:uncharacterized protein DDB_G0284459-like [Dreissena polymorpha]